MLDNAQCIEARAVIAFLNTYDPQKGRENPILAGHLEEILKGGNLVFKLDGSEGLIHQASEIRRIWEAHKNPSGDEHAGQCLITGEKAPIARLHPSLKGVTGANSTGATLVGFNARAYESYNRTGGQGLNSPISEKAAFAYATVLNYLLSSDNEKQEILHRRYNRGSIGRRAATRTTPPFSPACSNLTGIRLHRMTPPVLLAEIRRPNND